MTKEISINTLIEYFESKSNKLQWAYSQKETNTQNQNNKFITTIQLILTTIVLIITVANLLLTPISNYYTGTLIQNQDSMTNLAAGSLNNITKQLLNATMSSYEIAKEGFVKQTNTTRMIFFGLCIFVVLILLILIYLTYYGNKKIIEEEITQELNDILNILTHLHLIKIKLGNIIKNKDIIELIEPFYISTQDYLVRTRKTTEIILRKK
ncbi:hypothetical protein K9M74_03030 [Candidatus Woesearchaeota archaeon]|nr:hypothetical protein [Candidatus Woesearchaeota archaeon]